MLGWLGFCRNVSKGLTCLERSRAFDVLFPPGLNISSNIPKGSVAINADAELSKVGQRMDALPGSHAAKAGDNPVRVRPMFPVVGLY